MKKEYDLSKLKRRKARVAIPASELKTMISLRMDIDVLSWLKTEAERTGIPYQTLLTSILREKMNAGDIKEQLRLVIREELGNKRTGT
jgi:uncharacterized protein (DUF4415 family)